MKAEIVIIGAGAIGRGYLPWVFEPGDYDFVFVDTNRSIIDQMNAARSFTTYRVRDRQLEKRTIPVKAAYLSENYDRTKHREAAAVFINVGPRAAVKASRLVEGYTCPVILCENDPATVDDVVGASGLANVMFAVPDVITSNTAPKHLLAEDPLAIVSEEGVLFIDERARGLRGEFELLDSAQLLRQQWTAKLYLHNTPHCVAAYLGALAGVTYVHEAMAIPEIEAIVRGSMTEMLNSLKLKWDIPHDFLEWYAEKELKRFACELLFDPISRVAREPLRKLELEGRLLGAAQICLSLGFVPENILVGIASALLFDDQNDNDRHLAFMRRALTPTALLTHVLSLRKGEALERVLSERLERIIERLEILARKTRTKR